MMHFVRAGRRGNLTRVVFWIQSSVQFTIIRNGMPIDTLTTV
jgi:hypothetical protein